ncbi:MAG: hypothetical protein PHH85_03540 [Candidatus Methanoperedens sp.]|nr:hypothetical protein [Candidatus Methanoperedens sp.]
MTPEEFFELYFEGHPKPDDERIYEYDIDTVNVGQVATITYTVQSGWVLFLQEIWIDTPPNSAFEIYIKGKKYTTDNQIDLKDKPIKLNSGEKIVYKIYNNDSQNHTFENRIVGYGRRK